MKKSGNGEIISIGRMDKAEIKAGCKSAVEQHGISRMQCTYMDLVQLILKLYLGFANCTITTMMYL